MFNRDFRSEDKGGVYSQRQVGLRASLHVVCGRGGDRAMDVGALQWGCRRSTPRALSIEFYWWETSAGWGGAFSVSQGWMPQLSQRSVVGKTESCDGGLSEL